jgi:hypothetical protein
LRLYELPFPVGNICADNRQVMQHKLLSLVVIVTV